VIKVPVIDPYAFSESFYDFAFMPHFDDNVDSLVGVAEPEEWEYKHTSSDKPKLILRNYIIYTYHRIAEEKKIAVTEDEEHACWNTGLVTPHQEPIFILFEKNKLDDRTTYWHFWKFARKGQRELNLFRALPEMAHYFDDPTFLVYDTRKDLRANIEHIIADNRERFPNELRSMNDFGLQNIVKGAIDSAKERVKRNYKTAIPQYYNGAIQLLLPLCLTDAANRAKASLEWSLPRCGGFMQRCSGSTGEEGPKLSKAADKIIRETFC